MGRRQIQVGGTNRGRRGSDSPVIADLIGKAEHILTVPVPAWVKRAVDEWTGAAGIATGRLFRRVNKLGQIWGDGITSKAIRHVVSAGAKRADIQNLTPHDLMYKSARVRHVWAANWNREAAPTPSTTTFGSNLLKAWRAIPEARFGTPIT